MASSSIPQQISDEDDDGFDWEAAVREIDSACQSTATAAGSVLNRDDHSRPINAREPAVGSSYNLAEAVATAAAPKPRQSTLDRFVDSYQKKPGRNNNDVFRTPPFRQNALAGYEKLDGVDVMPDVKIDIEAAKTWIYPINVPLRDYQLSITKTALFSNTLVALPTGLGKTLIAAVVMYNYFRWFPEGKIVFAAPSRPLVLQQIEACHNIVGIPQEWTIDMTGQMSPPKRASFWNSKRIFFVTPQVLERDIESGICCVKQLVCLVVDEAHRALGNYSYCVAVRELMAVPVPLRILALTATPGSKHQTVQNVVDNLYISTLEYRDENDRDVSPYVHDRKLELIEVPMGEDAIGISNLLLEAVRPLVTRLCALGVLYNRDFAMMSPCELLTSRDKFGQAPPINLPHAKYGEVECYFGALITVYHIRKLLSSHGISPAHEMLEEKLKQGSFARLMSGNEAIRKAKLLIQHSASHGTPNPKLTKMVEILIDHFKKKGPRDSRVIIFSNFRGSVKDIMKSLTNIGDLIKATEFIGQSSGKALKGQSQKVQQAVLQKFRTGGYNVIVATSIGEEGLDIMEVDLVICFDANVSPLRMIQRMGRTGRKHDGRVVVLACEGSEVKGYLKKQASGKAVRKHMYNGGLRSFSFHASPRMVPHICKPEVQFVEFSIEKYVPRGRKVRDDMLHDSPCLEKLSHEENALLAKYFQPSGNRWSPSLIAFPAFQSFPSRVHKVRHSFRTTTMLIDTMQHLQGLLFSRSEKACIYEDRKSLSSHQDNAAECYDNSVEEPADSTFIQEANMDVLKSDKEKACHDEVSPLLRKDAAAADDVILKSFDHCFLFGEAFVTLNSFGSVLIATVPALPFTKATILEVNRNGDDTCSFKVANDTDHFLKPSISENGNATVPGNNMGTAILSDLRHVSTACTLRPSYPNSAQIECQSGDPFLQILSSPQKIEDNATEIPCACEYAISAPEVGHAGDKSRCLELNPSSRNDDPEDRPMQMDLSPRLTHFIEEGIVPESPESPIIETIRNPSTQENAACINLTPDSDNCGSPATCKTNNVNIENTVDNSLTGQQGKDAFVPHRAPPKMKSSLNGSEMGTPKKPTPEVERKELVLGSLGSKLNHTPLAHEAKSSCEDWQVNSEEAARSVTEAPKYKRLRRYKDIGEVLCKSLKENFECLVAATIEATRTKCNQEEDQGGKPKKAKKFACRFVDEEAEVSQDKEVSEDEEDDGNDDVYEGSFIDDRINQTDSATQAENSGGDMMAFYRRSLLSQSPLGIPSCQANPHEFISPPTTGSGSSSSNLASGVCETPQHNSIVKHYADPSSIKCLSISKQVSALAESSLFQSECLDEQVSKKRKLSFQQVTSKHEIDLHEKRIFHVNQAEKVICSTTEIPTGLLCDDDFYQGLDLDQLEAQATEILKHKPGMPVDSWTFISHPTGIKDPDIGFLSSPSFDLGL